jgi:tetratricopeptide (TPR) repeat protein
LEIEVARLRALQRDNRHAEALASAQQLLPDYPANRDLLLIEAISLRYLFRIDDALIALGRFEERHPRFSALYQERGLCHVARKDASSAIEALLRAVHLNPALPRSWSMLQGLYRLTGDLANAETAAARLAALQGLPPEILRATSLFFDREIDLAEQMIRAFLLRSGDHPEAIRLLGKIGVAREVYDEAEVLLAAALDLVPDHRSARYDYAQCLVLRHKYADALPHLDILMGLDPQNPDYRTLAATSAMGLGENVKAISIYRDMVVAAPSDPDPRLWLGHALKTVGQLPEAIAAYRSASRARPDFGDACWSLANLKTYRFDEAEIERMRAMEALSSTLTEDRIHFCFALGKALEDRGAFAESWTYYERGNALKRAESRYRPEFIENNTRNQIRFCTREVFEARAGWGERRPDPIFVVGLPRSGSTLIEQILASHSMVEGTHELSDIQRIVVDLQGRRPDPDDPRYPASMLALGREDIEALGRRYIEGTQAYRTDRPFFIDKMPNNFRHIGLIALILPAARIIDARREPMACCFSNLKQLFAQGQEFTYSIDDIARYYRTYLELMRHWEDVLPGRVLRVHHEDVVDDLEPNVRRILDFCGLPFEAACLAFHATQRSVRTPSSEQVRQPIFRDGLDQWRRYEPWLAPLKAALGDAVDRWREA